ncbi:MAG: hypothetical protein ACKVS9_01405 [Phycisphaerae bacterium]
MRRFNPVPATVISTIALLAIVGGGCPSDAQLGDPVPSGEGGAVLFETDIQPILTASCAGCHGGLPFAALLGADIDLRSGKSFDSLLNQSSRNAAGRVFVIPGDADNSYLIEKLTESNPQEGARMPLFRSALSQERIDLIRQWIEEGAANN